MDAGAGTTAVSSIGSPAADATFFGDPQWVTNLLAPVSGNSAAIQFQPDAFDTYLLSDTLSGVEGSLPRTISAWVRTTSAENVTIIDSGEEATGARFTFRLNSLNTQGVEGALRLEVAGGYAVANTPVNDGQWHHVAVSLPDGGSVDDLKLYVDGQLDGDATTAPFSGLADTTIATTASTVHIGHRVNGQFTYAGVMDEVRVWDEQLSDSAIAALVPSSLPTFGFVVDAATGNISLQNDFGSTVNQIVGYSLRSDAGNLDPTAWSSVADNYDADSGSSSFDSDDVWFKLTDTSPLTVEDLSEFAPNGDGGSLATGGAGLNLGNVWSPLPYEQVGDITAEIIFEGGERQAIGVSYINTTTAYEQGDLTLDGTIDQADWTLFRSNLLTSFPGLNKRDSYLLGDLDLDGDNDFDDFELFETLYDNARGLGAFQAMLAGGTQVPEPGSVLLMAGALAIALVCITVRRRPARLALAPSCTEVAPKVKKSAHDCLLLLIALLFTTLATTPAGAVDLVHYWDFEAGYDDVAGTADGTAGSLVTSATGHDGGTAANFVGEVASGFTADAYVDIDSSQFVSPGTGAFSMSYWFKIADDGTTNARGIFDFSGNGGDGPQSLYIGNTGNLAFRVDGTSGGQAALVPVSEDDQWHFVAATYDPSVGIQVHLDGYGVDASTTTTNFGNVVFDTDSYIGAFNVNDTIAARGLDGGLDDLAYYSGVLSQSEIEDLYSGAAVPSDFIPPPPVPLSLEVNILTGEVKMKYEGVEPIEFDYYQITSDGQQSLDLTAWTSLSDQDLADFPAGDGSGNGWEEAGGTPGAALGETFLDGFSTFTGETTPISLGTIFDTSKPHDLSFIYRNTDGFQQVGEVFYVDIAPLSGDYNGDGIVDLADYTVWRNNLGATDESAFAPGTGNGGGVDVSDYSEWKANFGATPSSIPEISNVSVPEPATYVVVLLAVAAYGLRRSARFACVLLALGVAGAAQANVTTDRLYTFGDDSNFMYDSWGDPFTGGVLTGTFADLISNVDVSTTSSVAPSPSAQSPFSNGSAAEFDGSTSYLRGPFLGRPEESIVSADYILSASVGDGPLNYNGIKARGFQLWANPDVAGGTIQTLVRDTTSHGVAIDASGNWAMRYASATISSTVPAATNQWSHLMMVAAEQTGGTTASPTYKAVLYVDGVAVAATSGTYNTANASFEASGGDLSLGANLDTNGDPVELFDGTLDELELFVAGTSKQTIYTDPLNNDTELPRVQYGSFDPYEDNDFISDHISTFGDLTGDGLVTSLDVNQFMAGWLSENRVSGLLVGDLNSYANGDLNFDGVVDIGDALEFNGIAISAGLGGIDFGLLGTAVPEPHTLSLLIAGLGMVVGFHRFK